jgi:hypothetical protein
MSVPGNKNALNWSLEKTEELLSEIEKLAYEEDVSYLGEALARTGMYRDAWAYWKRIWQDNDVIISRMKWVEQKFEARLFGGALRKKYHAGMATFCLRYNHRWIVTEEEKETDEEKKAKAREKDRIRRKVKEHNRANPSQRLSIAAEYTDVRPDHSYYTEMPGGLFMLDKRDK